MGRNHFLEINFGPLFTCIHLLRCRPGYTAILRQSGTWCLGNILSTYRLRIYFSPMNSVTQNACLQKSSWKIHKELNFIPTKTTGKNYGHPKAGTSIHVANCYAMFFPMHFCTKSKLLQPLGMRIFPLQDSRIMKHFWTLGNSEGSNPTHLPRIASLGVGGPDPNPFQSSQQKSPKFPL